MPRITFHNIWVHRHLTTDLPEEDTAALLADIGETFLIFTHGSRLHRLNGSPFWSVSNSIKSRILCVPENIDGEYTFSVYAVLDQHNYDDAPAYEKYLADTVKTNRSAFIKHHLLRQVQTTVFSFAAPPIVAGKYALADASPVIVFDELQEHVIEQLQAEAFGAHTFVNGVAGTGKSTLNLYDLFTSLSDYSGEDSILMLYPSDSVAREQEKLFYIAAQSEQQLHPEASIPSVSFYSVESYYRQIGLLPEHTKVANDASFYAWAASHRKTHPHSCHDLVKTPGGLYILQQEFKLISCRRLDQDSYFALPPSHAFLPRDDRETVYDLFGRYQAYLASQQIASLESIRAREEHYECVTQVIIDEVQQFPFACLEELAHISQLPLRMKGDFNQGPIYFRLDVLQATLKTQLRVWSLQDNKRSTVEVQEQTRITLDKLRMLLGGEFEKLCLPPTPPKAEARAELGSIFFDNTAHNFKEQLNRYFSPARLAKTTFVITDSADEAWLKAQFPPQQLLNILNAEEMTEISGRELDHVVLINPFASRHEIAYEAIARELKADTPDADDDSCADADGSASAAPSRHRPKDKQRAQTLLYLCQAMRDFYIKQSRARNSLHYICPPHPLLRHYPTITPEQALIEQQVSASAATSGSEIRENWLHNISTLIGQDGTVLQRGLNMLRRIEANNPLLEHIEKVLLSLRGQIIITGQLIHILCACDNMETLGQATLVIKALANGGPIDFQQVPPNIPATLMVNERLLIDRAIDQKAREYLFHQNLAKLTPSHRAHVIQIISAPLCEAENTARSTHDRAEQACRSMLTLFEQEARERTMLTKQLMGTRVDSFASGCLAYKQYQHVHIEHEEQLARQRIQFENQESLACQRTFRTARTTMLYELMGATADLHEIQINRLMTQQQKEYAYASLKASLLQLKYRYEAKNKDGEHYRPEKAQAIDRFLSILEPEGLESATTKKSFEALQEVINESCWLKNPENYFHPDGTALSSGKIGFDNLSRGLYQRLLGVISYFFSSFSKPTQAPSAPTNQTRGVTPR